MATKNAPSQYDGYAKADPDEPLFTLLARDLQAPALVRNWASTRWATHPNDPKIQEAHVIASAMEQWRWQNYSAQSCGCDRGAKHKCEQHTGGDDGR